MIIEITTSIVLFIASIVVFVLTIPLIIEIYKNKKDGFNDLVVYGIMLLLFIFTIAIAMMLMSLGLLEFITK